MRKQYLAHGRKTMKGIETTKLIAKKISGFTENFITIFPIAYHKTICKFHALTLLKEKDNNSNFFIHTGVLFKIYLPLNYLIKAPNVFMHKIFAIISLGFFTTSCYCPSTKEENSEFLFLERITSFGKGGPLGLNPHADTLSIIYKDDFVIEKINGINIIESKDSTITWNSPLVIKYIDLKEKTIHDYKTFSDTAQIIGTGRLTDSIFPHGWNFYSTKLLPLRNDPEILPDTAIDGKIFKRRKLRFIWNETADQYSIGYFDCNNETKILSLDPYLRNLIGCNMTKREDYVKGSEEPICIVELKISNNSLSDKELKAIEAWKMNADN